MNRQLAGQDEMQTLGIIVSAAMNDKVRTSGASANQWLFGKSPQMPFDLLDREGQIEALQGQEPDEELRLRQHIRAQADMLISQYKIDHALRTAVNRKGRPSRLTYEPGELVAFLEKREEEERQTSTAWMVSRHHYRTSSWHRRGQPEQLLGVFKRKTHPRVQGAAQTYIRYGALAH